MKINDRVEQLVRDALDAAVKEDMDRLDAALKAFPDEESRKQGLELAILIAVAVLFDTHGRLPNPEEVTQTAAIFSRTQGWAGVTAQDAHSFLTAAIKGDSLVNSLGPEKPVLVSFVVAAGLLATSPKVADDEWWFNYLDRIEAQLEAAQ